MKSRRSSLTSHMIEAYCEKRLLPVFSSQVVEVLRGHLVDLLERKEYPAYRGSRLDVHALAEGLGLDSRRLTEERSSLQPIFDAVTRSITESALRPEAHERNSPFRGHAHQTTSEHHSGGHKRRGKPPRLVVEYPDPLEPTWSEPSNFGAALRLHSRRHGESIYHLFNVRLHMFWDKLDPDLEEHLAHQVGDIMRPLCGGASAVA